MSFSTNLEQQLHELNDRLETLLNALPVGVLVIDFNTQKIIDANPQALLLFEGSLDYLIGKTCDELICSAQKGNCPIIDRGLNSDRSEREIVTAAGENVPVLKSAIKTNIEGTDVILECLIDIRDKKIAEIEHVKNVKLKSAMEIAGAVCHEFNQPLQILMGACELLQSNESVDEDAKETLKHMAKALDRMGTLTRNLSNITEYRTKDYMGSEIFDIQSPR